MKAFIIAASVAVLLIIAVLINSLLITGIIDNLTDEVENTEASYLSKDEFHGIYKKFKDYEPFISISVSHADLADINDAFAELLGACLAEDEVSVIIAKSRLGAAFAHLRRLSSTNIDSIF